MRCVDPTGHFVEASSSFGEQASDRLTVAHVERKPEMTNNSPKDGKPGTIEQSPRWEGPEENRPRGYLPANDKPDIDRDATGENNSDPVKKNISDALKTKGE